MAVEAGHFDVQQDDVGPVFTALFDSGQSVVCFDYVVVFCFQAGTDDGPDDKRVIRDQDRCGGQSRSARALGSVIIIRSPPVSTVPEMIVRTWPWGAGRMSASAMRRNPVTVSTCSPKVCSAISTTR